MFKKITGLTWLICCVACSLKAQELFPSAEPASNMPSKAIGVRLTAEGTFSSSFVRTIPELMIGVNKNLMFHAQAFLSDMDGRYKWEGGSLYAKYRFLSIDDVQKHLRMAVFGGISASNRNTLTDDINLEGDNSGWKGGLIITNLMHKLAISGTVSYNQSLEKRTVGTEKIPGDQLNYSLSSGYLLLPFVYKDYNQPNFNIYAEFLGKTNLDNGKSYLDLAPAIQTIINSRTRIDLGYRFQLAGNMANRYNKNMYLVRVEFNFFNALN